MRGSRDIGMRFGGTMKIAMERAMITVAWLCLLALVLVRRAAAGAVSVSGAGIEVCCG
jgi:hypothetical protein